MKRTFDSIIADFEKDAAIDFIGLWELVRVVKENLDKTKEEDLQLLTLDLLKRMLPRGFRVGYLSSSGNALEPWPDQQPTNVVARIKTEWNALDREPNIGDIAWFDHKSVAR